MRVENTYCYRATNPVWLSQVVELFKAIPEEIFFEQDGTPLNREVNQLDSMLFKAFLDRFGSNVENNFRAMAPENQFSIDFCLPTRPGTLIEVEKGKLPRLELDIMKIVNAIIKFPDKYGFGCIIAPTNYIRLNLAGKRSPYQYVKNQLLPLNSRILDFKGEDGAPIVKDFILIGYSDPRADKVNS